MTVHVKATIPGRQCDPSLQEEMRRRMAGLLKTRSTAFPGSQPVSFTRRHIDALKSDDYYLCEKSDGIRVLLFCTSVESRRDRHGTAQTQFLVDRKNNYYVLPTLHFPSLTRKVAGQNTYHIDTIVDGELVVDTVPGGTHRLTFLAFDCLMMEGSSIMDRPLDKRIGQLDLYFIKPFNAYLKDRQISPASIPFDVRFKQMQRGYAIAMMLDKVIPTLTHENDGLVFTRRETPYQIGTDENILKWKPADQNSIDFRLRLGEFPNPNSLGFSEEKPDISLCIWTGKSGGRHTYNLYAPLAVSDSEWEMLKSLDEQLDGRVIECVFGKDRQWHMKPNADGTPCFRDDKPEANHQSTARKVWESITDGVSKDDLLAETADIEHRWKERERLLASRAPSTKR